MIEAKAAYVENHGLSPGEWAISRVDNVDWSGTGWSNGSDRCA